ncbi:squalene/phytoene synthase family protein [Sphingomonas cannabina]|uniref:squalene/phytoene synthase family protein n=1 Tax=Sphingomonas cannabina TaxID=2899123 RepID=UPI001F2DF29B|nr:squalene/phytoene synthase family protein [Sphingomonas cannabina]UIJ43677.1 squalene/phytoene synthase family protein [Sphingomonas cannabina]
MTQETVTSQDEAERRLALAYAPPNQRAAMAALFTLDDALASVLRTTREPMVGQMRLTWWHDALTNLDGAPPPAEPVLQGLARDVLPLGVTGGTLAAMVEGWEELLEADPLSDTALEAFARLRGGTLFVAGGAGADDPLQAAGTGWALVDLARHARDVELAQRAGTLAAPYFEKALAARWNRANRGWGALAHLARLHDAAPPRRVGRALWHRMTGL